MWLQKLECTTPFLDFTTRTKEEASHDKLAAQSIHRELCEADEANLLEEEDMHVFDCKPMADPLHLVCCNACKKPVKASQYAAHAELCRSFSSTEENGLELDGDTGHKKPPRKGRKKLQTSQDNQATTVGEQERSESVDADENAASESNMDDQTGITYSSKEAKRTSMDGGPVMDGSGVSPRSANCSAGVMSPSKKHTKLMAAEGLLLSDDIGKACGVTGNMGINYHKALTYAPVPLATKTYHSQRNNRLRSALGHFYYEASRNWNDPLSPKLVQGNGMLPLQDSSPNHLLHEQTDGMLQKKDLHAVSAVRKPDQILAQSSELCLGASGGYPSVMNFSNQFRDNNFARSALPVDTNQMGMVRSNYVSTPYFSGNSGRPLGTMQKPKGSVSVI
ncbi:PREDICTED: uncharacterized protein LOC104588932 isoform X2 [Nelumbo nucifera]|uniref:Uncharacterized protein LOC104588932 isoform X2 n=1 Tax=Nelumbo nucifera TaxID=4432 RepID=A0A1U7ZBW9_NELNU|nr:PREDICTED: uncharacterized protein LOC104588932 isoform X2 [Nelumbo nucifera]